MPRPGAWPALSVGRKNMVGRRCLDPTESNCDHLRAERVLEEYVVDLLAPSACNGTGLTAENAMLLQFVLLSPPARAAVNDLSSQDSQDDYQG